MSDFENWLEHHKEFVRCNNGVVDDDDRTLARAAFEGGVIALARRLGIKVEEYGSLL